jgi:hypothetical protein
MGCAEKMMLLGMKQEFARTIRFPDVWTSRRPFKLQRESILVSKKMA